MKYAVCTLKTITNRMVETNAKNGINTAILIPLDRFMNCAVFTSYSATVLREANINKSKNLICIPVPIDIDIKKVEEIFIRHHESNGTLPKYDSGVDYSYINYKKYL